MGLLDSFLSPDDASSVQGSGLGTGLSAIGMALMSGNSRAPFANLPQAYASVASSEKSTMNRAALKQVLLQAGYDEATAEKLSTSEAAAKLAIQQKQQEKLLGSGSDAEPALFGGGSAPSMSPPAPAGPAAGVTLNGPTAGGLAPPSGNSAEVQSRFVDALKQGGLTNPIGLAAVAAYGQHESGYSPDKIAGSWSDPSESGQAGTSGGLLSWREGRLRNMQAATAGAKDPVAAQAGFFLNESPELTAALQNAKTPEEANRLMAEAWKFAGYNRPGGENAARLATTRSFVSRFGSNGAPQQAADAGASAAPGPPVANDASPGRPVQVANDENQTQVLEGRMSMYPPSVYGTAASAPAAPPRYGADTATGRALAARQAGAAGSSPVAAIDPADVPAQGSQEAGFVIPPGAAAKVESSVGKPPTPVSETTGATTQRAQALANFNYWGKRLRASAALGDAGKGLMEEAKIKMGLAQKFLEPSEAERLADAAGLSGSDRQQVLSGAIPGNAPTGERKDFEYAQRTPGYEEYQKRMKEAGRSQVNIDQRAEGKFEDGLGSKSADRFNTYIETGDKAKARLGDVNVLRETSRAIGGLGKAADFRAAVGPYLEAGGIKIDGLSDIQLFQSTAARLAPQLREPGAGATSDRDLAGFEKAIGSLSATPEAREKILDVFEAASRNQVEAGKIARDVAAKRITRLEGEDKLQNLPDPMTSFREYRKANPDPGAVPDRASGVQGSNGAAKSEAAPAYVPPKVETQTDRAVTISRAKEYVAKNPAKRDAIIKALQAQGIPTDAL